MNVSVFIQIKGRIDSKELYAAVEKYGINVTDIGDSCVVYGDCTLDEASRVVYVCGLYGDVTVEIKH